MLFDSRVCKIQSQNFKAMQKGDYKPRDLRDLFAENTKLRDKFAKEAYDILKKGSQLVNEDYKDNKELYAMYGVLLSGMVFGYDTDKETMSLYTSSIGVLKSLASKGQLRGKKGAVSTEIQTIEKKLYKGDAIRKSLSDGDKLAVVRLDAEMVDGDVIFTATVPRSAVRLSGYSLYAFDSVETCMQTLNKDLQTKILKISQGDKVRVVTKSIVVLETVYGKDRAEYLVSQVPDARIQRCYVPSVGASIYTSGLTNIHVEKITDVEEVQGISSLDLSEVNLDYTNAKPYFKKVLRGMRAQEIHELADWFGVDNTNSRQLKKEIISLVDCMYSRDVYDLMKEFDSVFDTKAYRELPQRFGTEYNSVDIPKTQEDFMKLVSSGIYKVLINNRKGTMSSIICTNNVKCLEKIYGRNYYGVYESEGNRLRAISGVLTKKYSNGVSEKTFRRLCKKYNLGYLQTKSGDLSEKDVKKVLKEIDKHIEEVDAKKTIIPQKHLVTVRSCEAVLSSERKPMDYFKAIDVNSIVAITRLL